MGPNCQHSKFVTLKLYIVSSLKEQLSKGLVVKKLDSQRRGPGYIWRQSNEYQEFLGTWW